MTPMPLPFSRDLVLIGGGHAHALVLRKWGMNPLPGVRLTVIDPGPAAPYTGMLPGLVAGHYDKDALEIDLVRLARFAGARLIVVPATGIDPATGLIHVAGRAPVGFDVASVDVGVHSDMPVLPGFSNHGVPAKPLGPFAAAWTEFLTRAEAGEAAPQAVVIGGGIAGIELALAMAHGLATRTGGAAITLIESQQDIAPDTPSVRAPLLRALARANVQVLTGANVARVTGDGVELADGTDVASAFTAGAAGARAHAWLTETGLATTDDGFLRVGPDLRIEGQDAIFAAGDCAHLTHAPRPKAGVFAVRAAPVLHNNLRAVLRGTPTRPFRPQRTYLKLISLGHKAALAEKAGLTLAAPGLWRWKDRIDRAFMSRLTDLPVMAAPPLPAEHAQGLEQEGQPLCAGCGSKIAPGALGATLSTLPPSARCDILTGPGDDAAIIQVGSVKQVLTVDHLRAFSLDHGLLARVATLHALGDIWAMGAQPSTAMISLTLPRMTQDLQSRTLREVMSTIHDTLHEAGAAIVGGHSTMGAEMTLGLSLTGTLTGRALTTSGAKARDALILTRPLGSGTLLAAEMQGRARGYDIADLWRVLARPQGDAAAILATAHAMTDVTGFGLAGHLGAICRASGLGAEIALQDLPVFAGAEALAAEGVRSSLWQANQNATPVEGGNGPRTALLHDPQTAGGLLAAVPEADASRYVEALKTAGHHAARIGQMVPGSARVRVV